MGGRPPLGTAAAEPAWDTAPVVGTTGAAATGSTRYVLFPPGSTDAVRNCATEATASAAPVVGTAAAGAALVAALALLGGVLSLRTAKLRRGTVFARLSGGCSAIFSFVKKAWPWTR